VPGGTQTSSATLTRLTPVKNGGPPLYLYLPLKKCHLQRFSVSQSMSNIISSTSSQTMAAHKGMPWTVKPRRKDPKMAISAFGSIQLINWFHISAYEGLFTSRI